MSSVVTKESFYKQITHSLKYASKAFVPVMLSCPVPLLATFVVVQFFNVILIFQLKTFGDIPTVAISSRVGLVLTSLLQSISLVLLLPPRLFERHLGHAPASLSLFAKKHFWPLFLESLRVMWRVIAGFFLLIIPSFYWSIIYFFVPYVVFFDSEYDKGNVDALVRSREQIRPIFWRLTALMIVEILVGFIIQSVELRGSILYMISTKVLFSGIGYFWTIYFHCIYFYFYIKTQPKTTTESLHP